jgi:hypothetical protein
VATRRQWSHTFNILEEMIKFYTQASVMVRVGWDSKYFLSPMIFWRNDGLH